MFQPLPSVGVDCGREFHPLYLGQVIRVFETGEHAVNSHRRYDTLEPQRYRTGGGEGKIVEHCKGTFLEQSGFRVSAEIGK